MDRMDQELNSLFAAYREAVPDPEPSADFMPRLWSRIEAKRSFVFRLRRMSQVAVTAALAACLVGGVLILPFTQHTNQLAGTYVDVLADAHADDTIAGGFRLDLLDAEQH
jgi:hypothetical protein